MLQVKKKFLQFYRNIHAVEQHAVRNGERDRGEVEYPLHRSCRNDPVCNGLGRSRRHGDDNDIDTFLSQHAGSVLYGVAGSSLDMRSDFRRVDVEEGLNLKLLVPERLIP